MTATPTRLNPVAQWAALYRSRGLALCKPDPNEKKPTYPGWPTRSLEPDDFGPGDLIGVMGGPLSDCNRERHALVIIDLDAAAALELADDYLPPTGMVEGRSKKPQAHRYYAVPVASIPAWAESPAPQGGRAAKIATGHPGPWKKQFCHAETKACVIDFIGTGGQCVAPPSRHPSGESREWVGGEPGEPAAVPFPELWDAACRLAAACGCNVPHPPGANGSAANRSGRPAEGFRAQAGPTPEDRAVAYLARCPGAVSGQGGHKMTFYAARAVVYGFDLGADAGLDLLLRHYNPKCQPQWAEHELRHKCEDADRLPFHKPRGWLRDQPDPNWDAGDFEKRGAPAGANGDNVTIEGVSAESVGTPQPTADPVNETVEDPFRLARGFAGRHRRDGVYTVRYWREEWFRWDGRAYRALQEQDVRAELTAHVKAEFDAAHARDVGRWERRGRKDEKGNDAPRPVARKVTRGVVSDALQALASLTLLPSEVEAPAWVGDPGDAFAGCEPKDMLSFRNGLGHVPTLATESVLYPQTPRFFGLNALDYDYVPDAPEPAAWLHYLGELWPGDPQPAQTLQEWFGYSLTRDTSLQKILMMVGPKRGGKGTAMRVLRRAIGESNCCSPTLGSLGGNFGLQPLLGKTLAVISDARLSARTDTAVVAERLLSVSGEDDVTVDRKFLRAVTAKLPVRFVIVTNELPRVTDTSGALVGRFVVLPMTRSWYGKEDTRLTDKLLAELPGILLWALEGWLRLSRRGRFVQPDCGTKAIQLMEELSSPVGAFVQQRCEVGPGFETPVSEVYAAWQKWCECAGRHPSTEQVFGRDLRAVVPHLGVTQPRRNGVRIRCYEGLQLKPPEEGDWHAVARVPSYCTREREEDMY